MESEILGFVIRNAAKRIQNPRSTDKDCNRYIQCLESEIHCMESRIRDYLGFTYILRRKTKFSTRWGGGKDVRLSTIFCWVVRNIVGSMQVVLRYYYTMQDHIQ